MLAGRRRLIMSANPKNSSALVSDNLKMLQCIEKLGAEELEVYLMVEQGQRAIDEVAALTHREESAVRELLASARRELKRLFFEI